MCFFIPLTNKLGTASLENHTMDGQSRTPNDDAEQQNEVVHCLTFFILGYYYFYLYKKTLTAGKDLNLQLYPPFYSSSDIVFA